MKLKSFLLNGVILLILALLGYGVGKLIGNLFIGESDPLWKYYQLPVSPKKIISIVYLQLSSTSETDDPTGDSLFVKTNNGDFYSYTLFQDEWVLVDTDPTQWENPYVSKCAVEWNETSEFSKLKSYPPITKDVIDSVGINSWRYPSTSIARCYIFLDDGSVQAWTYSGNAANLVENRLWKTWFMISGLIAGIILGLFSIRYKIKQMETEKTTRRSGL